MRLAQTEEYGSQSQIPHPHNHLPNRASTPRITRPIRIPNLRIPYEATPSRKTVEQPQQKIQPDNRRIKRNNKNHSEGNQIQHALLQLTRTIKSRITHPHHDKREEVAERRGHEERVYQVHSDTSFKKPSYYVFGGMI